MATTRELLEGEEEELDDGEKREDSVLSPFVRLSLACLLSLSLSVRTYACVYPHVPRAEQICWLSEASDEQSSKAVAGSTEITSQLSSNLAAAIHYYILGLLRDL